MCTGCMGSRWPHSSQLISLTGELTLLGQLCVGSPCAELQRGLPLLSCVCCFQSFLKLSSTALS